MLNQNGKTNLNKGYVTQIIGPVLDIKFSENLPPIYSAIQGDSVEMLLSFIVEITAIVGDNKVRAVSMRSMSGARKL
jgi:F-type H+-transporting ATPase subunit beta